MSGMKDGMGGEELGQTGSQPSNMWLTGSVTSESNISGANVYATTLVQSDSMSVGNGVVTGSLTSPDIVQTAGSPYLKGDILKVFPADSIISGGMWVMGSEGIVTPSPSDGMSPLGVCVSNTASGSVCPVMTRGIAYMVADASVTANQQVKQSAGAALNTIESTTASGARGICLEGASSGGTARVYIW